MGKSPSASFRHLQNYFYLHREKLARGSSLADAKQDKKTGIKSWNENPGAGQKSWNKKLDKELGKAVLPEPLTASRGITWALINAVLLQAQSFPK